MAIICIMARKVQHNVRWEGWIKNAVDAWGQANGGKSFSDSVNYLLAIELERWGYRRMHYEPGLTDAFPQGDEQKMTERIEFDDENQSIKAIRAPITKESSESKTA